ncbi:uncharacterized protein LOC112056859 [Bicyclus anynana]|uniref:Uncharacterized protein LOC112056859 n=1 Tax=Bicyclus anynana TaxID=110368 RepID=A0ABM3LJ09_BICAN|nr:uncharacterized protein LOC112056859 [Bicyclus anynana]
MDSKVKIIELKPDTEEHIRKLYNFDNPGSLEDAVNILNEWVQQQPHFNKKDFNSRYLETAIISNKGSIERAKLQLDKMCTLRTLLPHFFGKYSVKTDFGNLYESVHSVMLPKLTEDHYRVNLIKFYDGEWSTSLSTNFYRYNIILAEYFRLHDYVNGGVLVADFLDANLMTIWENKNPGQLRQALSVLIHGYIVRVKGIYILADSKIIDGIVMLFKQVISSKMASRLKVLKRREDLYEFVPKALLPKDYGGEERSLKTLQDEWIDVLSSEEHLTYLNAMNAATTNESCRPKDQFSEQYAGMPGTFRYLSVD